MEPSEVLVARVVKPHGIRGEVVVDVLSDVPDRLAAGTVVRGPSGPLTVGTARPHQGRLLIRFDGVGDRTAAEGLRGIELWAEAIALDDEWYYAHELVGMVVRGVDGAVLGEVRDVITLPEAAGYDLLEVARGETVWLLPAVDDYVEVVDEGDGEALVVTADAPEGLVPPHAGGPSVGGPTPGRSGEDDRPGTVEADA